MLWLLLLPLLCEAKHPVIEVAERYVGVREVGYNRGALIDEWNRWVGVPLGSPYCASFASWVLHNSGYGWVLAGRKTAHALTLYAYSLPVLRRPIGVARNLDSVMILVWRWGGTVRGHVGFMERVRGAYVYTIEANTACGGMVDTEAAQREGNGVCRRVREKRTMYAPGRIFRVYGAIVLPWRAARTKNGAQES